MHSSARSGLVLCATCLEDRFISQEDNGKQELGAWIIKINVPRKVQLVIVAGYVLDMDVFFVSR